MFRNICGEIGFNKLERSSNKAANQRRGSFLAPFLPQILAQESTINNQQLTTNNQQPTDNRSIVLIVRGFASTDGPVSYLI